MTNVTNGTVNKVLWWVISILGVLLTTGIVSAFSYIMYRQNMLESLYLNRTERIAILEDKVNTLGAYNIEGRLIRMETNIDEIKRSLERAIKN